MKFTKFNNHGSSLIVIVILTAVTFILAAALSTAIISTNTLSTQNLNTQQAYFTARSAVQAAVAKLNDENDSSFRNYVNSLADNTDYKSDAGAIAGGGNFILTIRKSGETLKITGTGFYPSSSAASKAVSSVNVTLKNQSDSSGNSGVPSVINPFKNLIYVTDPTSSINPSQWYGDIMFTGNIALSSGSSVNGNVYAGGSLSVSGGAKITKNAYVIGSLSMSGNMISGDAFCLGNVSFSGQSNQIGGTLHYRGTASYAYGTLATFAPNNIKDSNLSFEIPSAPAEADTSLPKSVDAFVRSNFITITPYTTAINTSGTIASCDNWAQSNKPVTIDTTQGDIYLLINKSIELQNRQFYVAGSNHLYIYLEGNGTKLTLCGGNPVIRMLSNQNPSNIFVIGGEGTVLELDSAEIAGAVYMPKGTIGIHGGVGNNGIQDGYAIKGSIVVKTAKIDSNLKLMYQAPNLDNTPLSDLNDDGNQSGKNKWNILYWGK